MSRRSCRTAPHASRQVLVLAGSQCAMAVLLLFLSFGLRGSHHPVLLGIARGLATPAWGVLLVGLVAGAIGLALRPRRADAPETVEPPWFADSTGFARSAALPLAPDRGSSERRAPATAWRAQVFEDIEWRRFEALCAELFAQAGSEIRTQSHGADDGVDLWLQSRHAEAPAAVVRCKHRHGKPVGVEEVDEFLAVMASRKLARGTFVTTSTFTPDALRIARENGIVPLDGDGLLALVAKQPLDQQQLLLARAYEGEYWRPTCASCGQKMVARTARKTGKDFWGCADAPRCLSTLPMRA